MRVRERKGYSDSTIWEEESGLIDFLGGVQSEVERFNTKLGFSLKLLVSPPAEIDGEKETVRNLGFVVVRENRLMPERMFCLYSLLEGKTLYGYIGIYRDGSISTYRELKPANDFRNDLILYDWLRELLKTSCDK